MEGRKKDLNTKQQCEDEEYRKSKMQGLISHHFSTEELNLQGHVAAYSVRGI